MTALILVMSHKLCGCFSLGEAGAASGQITVLQNINSNSVKNLLFITGHRHVEQISVYADCLRRTEEVKNYDLILHVNKSDGDMTAIINNFKRLPNKNKHLIVTDKNDGFTFGLVEALNDFFGIFADYENVIHSHVDVFICNEGDFIKVLSSHKDKAMLVNISIPTIPDWMSSDLFVFRPKLLGVNFFGNFVQYKGSGVCCEQFIFREVVKNKIPHQFIRRFHDNYFAPRRICEWGCWHEHDIDAIKRWLTSAEQTT